MLDIFKDKILKEIEKHIKLKARGSLFWAKCPFHNENTASFAVNPEKQFYHCFGCGAHGNVFNFLMNYKNLSFKEVLLELGETYNIKIKKTYYVNYENLLEEVKNYYQNNLDPQVITYLTNRGINSELIEKFHIGFAKKETVEDIFNKGYTIKDLVNIGVCAVNNYDRFRHRIIFPIFDRQKKTIGFSGRVLDDSKPKFLNPKSY